MSEENLDNNSNELSQEQALAGLFNRFVSSSSQLEQSYQALRDETVDLRLRLKAKDEEIAQATRLATLGQAAAALAHEIRNPLGAIKLFSSLLKEELAERPQGLEFLGHIQQSIGQLDATISNILQFTKQGPVVLSPINLTALLRERIAAFCLSHPKVIVHENLNEELFVSGIEQSLRQILNNLLTNASQALKGSGRIEILLNKYQSGEIVLSVHDSGPGIATSVLPQLFEPFVTSKNDGIGLGLAIVKRLITQQGASIEAKNQDGAVFTITFPALEASNKRLAA